MKLTKIRLINWMYFHDVTISLAGNAAIAGANGSGKTSLIDALQYALTGSKGQSRFNSAQGDSKRTLESYVRGHVGDSTTEYLRPNLAESYVALEVSDGQKTNVFGVYVLYNPSNNSTREQRFVVDDKKIDELDFKIENKVVPIKEFRESNKDNYRSLNSVKTYQDNLSNLLGLSKDSNYFKLVVSAINRRQINSVNDFIKDLLLEENIINIDDAQQMLYQIRKLKQTLETNEERYQALKIINKDYNSYKDLLEQVNNLTKEQTYLKYNYTNNQLELDESRKKSNDQFIEENSHKLKELEARESKQRINLTKLITNRNEQHPNIDIVKNELDKLAKEKSNYKNDTVKYNTLLNKAKDALESLEDFDLAEINSLIRLKNSNNEFENNNILTSLNEKVNSYKNNLLIKESELRKDLNEIKQDIKKTEEEIATLKKGFHKYPDNVSKLIKLLKQDFKNIYNEDIIVKPLAEFLELKENSEQYRDAIEGYLNEERHHLIIESRHFNKAVRTYDKYQDEVHSVKIIDGAKLKYNEAKENTLAEHVSSTNEIARNYVNSLLNKVVIVDDVSDLRNHKTAITKTCLLYQNNGITKINPEIYKRPFIGRNAVKIKLDQEEKNLMILNENYDIKYKELKNNKNEQKIVNNIELLKISNLSLTASFYLYNKTKDEYDSKEKEYNTLKQDNNYLLLTEQINKLQDKQEKLHNEIKDIEVSVRIKDEDNKKLLENIKSHKELLKEYINEYNKITNIEKSNLDSKYYNVKITRVIQDEQSKVINKKSSELNNSKINLERLLESYVHNYFVNFKPEISHIDSFINEYFELVKTRFDIKKDIVDLESKYKELLVKGFLNDVEEEIYKVTEIVKKINANLRTKTFGSDSYRIVLDKSKTKELSYIYDVAVEGNLTTTLENHEESYKSIDKIREIISLYLDESNNKDINMLLDVRNYFEFDVIVRSGDHRKSLMQMLDKQSGGESQVPFYILIAAAFEETMEKRKEEHEKLCIVLFDEAFNNMDGQRVEEMLKFFNELNIQVIISVPGKYDSIVPYVETTLIVTRENETGEIHDVNVLRDKYSASIN